MFGCVLSAQNKRICYVYGLKLKVILSRLLWLQCVFFLQYWTIRSFRVIIWTYLDLHMMWSELDWLVWYKGRVCRLRIFFYSDFVVFMRFIVFGDAVVCIFYFCTSFSSVVGKVRPAGQIRPASSVHPARGGPSDLTLNSARKTYWTMSDCFHAERDLVAH